MINVINTIPKNETYIIPNQRLSCLFKLIFIFPFFFTFRLHYFRYNKYFFNFIKVLFLLQEKKRLKYNVGHYI